jgi:hypothetical protein
MTCKLCETRRPRRACPGVGGRICAVCCGTERETTVSCPLDCPFLQEAHRHEKPPEIDPEQVPNRDVEVSEEFIDERRGLVMFSAFSLLEAALQASSAVDSDVREALESLIRTYRTRESGLYYETRPANLLAAHIHQHMQKSFDEYRKSELERAGLTTVRDAEILGVLVFWQRVALRYNHGRRLGRPFLSMLRNSLAEAGLSHGPQGWQTRSQSPLVIP